MSYMLVCSIAVITLSIGGHYAVGSAASLRCCAAGQNTKTSCPVASVRLSDCHM
jgi:hypothetical protein